MPRSIIFIRIVFALLFLFPRWVAYRDGIPQFRTHGFLFWPPTWKSIELENGVAQLHTFQPDMAYLLSLLGLLLLFEFVIISTVLIHPYRKDQEEEERDA